jgi:WD40 repeat protein
MKNISLVTAIAVLAFAAGCERDFGVNRRNQTEPPVIHGHSFVEPEIVHILYGSHQFVIHWRKAAGEDFRAYTLYQSLSPDMNGASGIYRSENQNDTCHAVDGVEKNRTRYYQIEVQYADSTARQKSVAVASSSDRILVSGYSWHSMGVNSVDINANWLVHIAPNGCLAEPSRDGGKIVFCSTRNETDYTVETVNADGSDRRAVADSMSWNGFPEFSPDGSKIVYVALFNKIPCVFTADADGSNRVRLTDAESIAPRFTADGSAVVYHRRSRFGQDYLYRVNSDGTDPMRIGDLAPAGGLAVSPDGDHIVFTAQLGENFGLCGARLDGSDYRVLVTSSGSVGDERFSPDGSKIVYACMTGPISEDSDIRIMNADGSGNLLLKTGGSSSMPRFSPDGTRVVFQCYDGGSLGVYMVNADGSGLTRVGGELWGAEYPVFLAVE